MKNRPITPMSDSPTHLTMKPRSTSTLDAWSKEQSEPLDHWRFEVNRSYEEVGGWLAKEHGVTTTKSSLSRYYRRPLAPRRQARAPIAANGGEEATLARPRHLALAAQMEPQPDRPTAHRLLDMVTAPERTRRAQARGAGQRAWSATTTRGTSRQINGNCTLLQKITAQKI